VNGLIANTADTYALVVGIEQYASGTTWDLDGPASDASRFAGWLRRRGVPADQILLYLSPLERNSNLLTTWPGALPARRADVEDGITNTLRGKRGDLLCVFWAGHGVVGADGTRRLFYADATQENRWNLDLHALLTAMRTSYFPGLKRQLFIVDACANYYYDPAITLPGQGFPTGVASTSHHQFVLMGARAGELAQNLAAEKTGLFSREVMSRLEAERTDWPPNMDEIAARLRVRFTELRNAGEAGQAPAYFHSQDWAGNEVALGQVAPSTSRSVPHASLPRGLTPTELNQLINALLSIPVVLNPTDRDVVVADLRFDIRTAISRSDNARIQARNIIMTCRNYVGGIRELLDVTAIYAGNNSIAWQRFQEAVRATIPDELT
jgi:hypothetical protein